jgi:hypothetical protein
MTHTETTLNASTLRLLVFAVASTYRPNQLEGVHVLAAGGDAPNGANFSLGDDITYGESCEFGDGGESPAEFHYEQRVETGLWIVEWDWKLTTPDPDDDELETLYREALYSHDRWTRPTPADLIAFGVMPEPANV